MSEAVTIAKGIIEIGATGVTDAQNEIQDLKVKLQLLDAQYRAGNVTVSSYAARTAELKGQIASLQDGIDLAEKTMKRFGGSSQKALDSLEAMSRKSSASARGTAQAMQELGRGVEDFATGGFLGGLNNIPRMFEGIGQAAGMTGPKLAAVGTGISLFATGAYVLYQSGVLGKIAEQLGFFREEAERSYDEIDRLKLKIKELEEKPIKLAVDTFELDQAKKKLSELEQAKKAFERIGDTRNPFEAESGQAVADMFSVLDVAKGDDVQKALKAKMVQELLGNSESIKNVSREEAKAVVNQRKAEARLQSAGSMGGQQQAMNDVAAAKEAVEAAKEAARKARYEITKEGGEAERELAKIWGDATKGNVEAQKKLAARLRGIGEESLAQGVEAASPAEQQKQHEIDSALDRSIEQQREGRRRTNEKKKIADADEEHEIQAGKMLRERRDKEDQRLAGAMSGSVGQKYLRNPGMTDEALQEEVKTAMALAGISSEEVSEAAEGVAKKIKKAMDESIASRALARDDHNPEKARAELLKEAQAKDDKQAGAQKSEIMSTKSYLDKILVASLGKPKEDIAKEQLVEAKSTNKKFDKLIEEVAKPKRAIPATFGPGR